MPAPARVPSPAERQALRARREQQNINVTLYIASLLLVAAGALFIGAGLPAPLRFAGVCFITALFYVAGLVLHAKTPRLKPAAVAFSGTGLALIPVTGLAMFNLAVHNAPLSWLVTSVIGTAAYVVAAVRLESRVLVYLSMTIVVSTAWSGVSVLGGALIWYFTALIGVAACFTGLAIYKPKWVPPVYVRPLAELHPFMVPAVAVAATMVPLLLERGDYARIMAMCGCYFVLVSVLPGARFRQLQYIAARASLTVAAAAAVWDLTGRGSAGISAAVVAVAVQVLLAALGAGRLPALLARVMQHSGWRLDALITFGVQLLLTVALALAQRQETFPGQVPSAGALPLWLAALLALVSGGVLAWKLRGDAEWAPAAALAMCVVLADWLGAWVLTGLLLAGAAFWAVRSIPATERLRHHFILGARVTVTLAAPVLTAAVVGDDNDARSSYAALALCLALALQQLATAALIGRGMRALMPQASLAGFTGAGVAAMTVLALGHQEPFPAPLADGYLAGTAVAAQLITSLSVGLMLFPRPEAGQRWRPSIAEAVPLAVAAVAVPLAFDAVSLGLGNAMLLLVTAYLAGTATRVSRQVPRRCYWWLSRASATVLTLTVFHQIQRGAGPVLVGGEVLAPATVLAVALSLQLIVPLRQGRRGTVPGHVFADAAAVLALQAAALVLPELGSRADGLEPASSWQAVFTTLLLAGGSAAAGYVLRTHPLAVAFAPSAFALLLSLRGDSVPYVELLLGVFAVFSAVMVAAVQGRVLRGGYFAAARVLTAALAVVLSYDLSASPTVVAVTFALVFAAQHVIRWLMRHRLAEVPFQQAAVWITLAGQAALPVAYLARPFGAGTAANDGGRWVLLLALLLLLVSAVAARRLFAARGAAYLGLYAALFGVVALGPLLRFPEQGDPAALLSSPVLSHDGVALLLLGMSLAATAGGILRRYRNGGGVDHWLWLAAAVSFGTSSAMLAPPAADGISGAAVLGLAAACFAASHVERLPGFYLPAVLAALAGATMTADEIFADVSGPWGFYLPWLAGSGVAACALYAAKVIRGMPQAPALAGRPMHGSPGRVQEPRHPMQRREVNGRDVRSLSLVAAAVLGLAIAGLAGLVYSETSWTGAALVAMAAVVLWLEVPPRVRRFTAELGSLAVTAAIQRAALFVGPLFTGTAGEYGSPDPEVWTAYLWPDPFWTAQWYVVLAGVLGVLRYWSNHRDGGRLYLGLAAGLLSVSGMLVIFGGDAAQQLWVLALFAALLVAGLGYGERMLVWWGAAGVTLCVMWAMRQYTYMLLALIAAGLIALALWRLSRSKPAGTD